MLSSAGGHRGKGGSGHRSMERCHRITRNPSDGRTSTGQAPSQKGQKIGKPSMTVQLKDKQAPNRTRPTNNQLLYKAYFRWHHYPAHSSHLDGDVSLPQETDACASVTAAFLQVLHGLQEAERARPSKPRNVLMLLAHDTRHTKVVDLASSTHRVSDELKRHCLLDDNRHQYTTNLDRNRYGNDDQYMFTVIRHNLGLLDLCPCLVDVEVLDQKSNESTLVSAGADACMCHNCDKSHAEGMDRGHVSVSRGDRFDALLQAATRDTVNEASSANGSPLKSSSVKVATKSRSMSAYSGRKHQMSGGEVDSLQHAINAFNSDPTFTDATRDSSKKQVPKRSFSSHQHVSKQLDASVSDLHTQWGRAETVEDNVHGTESGTGEAPPPVDTAVIGAKRKRDGDHGDPDEWGNERKYKVGRQASSVGPRSAGAAELKKLHEDVSQLFIEGKRNREELSEARKEISILASLKRDFDEDRARWRKVESELQGLRDEVRRLNADRLAHEERNLAAETQLAENRQVINILLNRVYRLLVEQKAQTITGVSENAVATSIPSITLGQSQERVATGRNPPGPIVPQMLHARHSSLQGVDSATQVQIHPSNIMFALSGPHGPEPSTDPLNATLFPNVPPVDHKSASLLTCAQGGLRTTTGLSNWNTSQSSLSMMRPIDEFSQCEEHAVVIRNSE